MADDAAGGSSTPASNAPDTPQTAPKADEAPWLKVKHKIKVDQQEHDLDYGELITRAQKATAAEKRIQEAAETRNKLLQAWNASDPNSYFKAKNVDPEKWAEDLLLKKIKLQSMTSEQRASHEKDEADKAERAREKEEVESLRKEKLALVTEKVVKQLDTEILDAFKAINVSPEPLLIKRMAEIMDMYMDTHDGQMMPAKKALEQALGMRNADTDTRLKTLSVDDLLKSLSKDQLDGIRKHFVDLVRSQSPLSRGSTNGASKPSTPAAKAKKTSTEEYFRQMEEKLSS